MADQGRQGSLVRGGHRLRPRRLLIGPPRGPGDGGSGGSPPGLALRAWAKPPCGEHGRPPRPPGKHCGPRRSRPQADEQQKLARPTSRLGLPTVSCQCLTCVAHSSSPPITVTAITAAQVLHVTPRPILRRIRAQPNPIRTPISNSRISPVAISGLLYWTVSVRFC